MVLSLKAAFLAATTMTDPTIAAAPPQTPAQLEQAVFSPQKPGSPAQIFQVAATSSSGGTAFDQFKGTYGNEPKLKPLIAQVEGAKPEHKALALANVALNPIIFGNQAEMPRLKTSIGLLQQAYSIDPQDPTVAANLGYFGYVRGFGGLKPDINKGANMMIDALKNTADNPTCRAEIKFAETQLAWLANNNKLDAATESRAHEVLGSSPSAGARPGTP